MSDTQQLASIGSFGRELEDYLPLLKTNFETAELQTRVLNPDRMMNLAYYVGNQFYQWDSSMGLVMPPRVNNRKGDVMPMCDNVIGTLLDTRVGMMSNNPPKMEVVSTNNDMLDMAQANVCNQAAEMLWDKGGWSTFFAAGHKIAGLMYNCFCHMYWDYSAGRRVMRPNSQGQMVLQPEGDIAIELVTPMEVYVDPLASRVVPEWERTGDARWLFRDRLMDIGKLLKSNWNRPAQEAVAVAGNRVIWGGLPPESDIHPHDTIAESQDKIAMYGILGIDATRMAEGVSIHQDKKTKDNRGKVVLVRYYYEQPSGEYPNGRFMAFLPDNGWWLLENREELPHATATHKNGLFGWCMLNDVPLHERLAGKCRFTDTRPLQDEYNKVLTSWRAARNHVLLYLLADKDSDIDPRKYQQGDLVKIFEYHSTVGGNPPQAILPPAVVQEAQLAMEEIANLTGRMEDRMQIHSTAYYPRNSRTTAWELNAFLQQDQDRLESNDVALAEDNVYGPWVKLGLRFMQRYYDEPRMIAAFSDVNKPVVKKFAGKDIHFENVRVVRGTSLRKSRVLQENKAMALLQANVFAGDPSKPETFDRRRAEIMEMVGLKTTLDQLPDQLDRDWARAEFIAALDGKEPSVDAEVDNNSIHILQHQTDMKSAVYHNLPPDKQQALRSLMIPHIQLHNLELTKDMLASPESQMAAAQQEMAQTQAGLAVQQAGSQPGQAEANSGTLLGQAGGSESPANPTV